MKMRIRNKILLTICSLILLSLAGQIIFNLFFSKSFFLHQQKSIISTSYASIKAQYSDDLEKVNAVAENLQNTYSIKTLIWENDEMVYASGYTFFNQLPKQPWNKLLTGAFAAEPQVVLSKMPSPTGENERLQLSGTFSYQDREVKILLSLPLSSIENSIAVFTEANIYISLAVLLIGVLLTLVISKNITAPIVAIEAVSKKISALDFSAAAEENHPTIELASLAHSVNEMSRQLDNSIHELNQANEALRKDIDYRKQLELMRRDFIASISHEMKTPLALLQIYAENLKKNIAGIDKDYYCDTILEETGNLNQMVCEMLEISSIESGFIEMQPEKLDLSELCRDILQQYQPLLQQYRVETAIDEQVWIAGDPKYVERTIQNLLNNAVQHTRAGDRIRLSLRQTGAQAALEIYNQGKPIAEEDLLHLWDAFYRTDKARTHNGKNNIGLGLYIVKTVMEKHHGAYSIGNQADGVNACVTFPTLDAGCS